MHESLRRYGGILVHLICLSTALALSSCSRGGVGTPAPGRTAAQLPEPPRLVVLVVVDQLRADLLTRYADLFQDGLRRLLDEGFSFTQASHRHAGTFTAPGHATISTGVFPSRHGIVANEWSERAGDGWRSVYNTFDSTSAIVGVEGLEGRSPSNLIRTGLPDWVREADDDARIVSVSTKDRSAILLAGKSGGHVYWIDSAVGAFVTSEFYRARLPGWVEELNAREMSALHGDSVWASVVPAPARARSRPDSFPFEFDGIHTAFPHDAREELGDVTPGGFRDWIRHTPRLDEGTLGLALAAMDELRLGQRNGTDYLAISFSQVDYVGHRFGPLSREQLDNLLRLDQRVGELMSTLDERVGQGRWVLALTADHGVVDVPEWRRERGEAGARVARADLRALISDLNELLASGEASATVRSRVRERALAAPFVAAVYPHSSLLTGERPDSFATLLANSYYPGREAGLLARVGMAVRMSEGTISDGSVRGTTHGSPYWYDRHVPLLFVGAGVESGQSDEPVYTVDVAPTLAFLAGVAFPGDLDGRALLR